MRIADLHCDLLAYLAGDSKRTIHDEEPRCSLPQLKKGGVVFQTLAVYTVTGKNSTASAQRQLEIFRDLPNLYPNDFVHLKEFKVPQSGQPIHIVASIENASGLCDEEEPLDLCFERFEAYSKLAAPFFYISLTWNHQNRFGGGNFTSVGLKPDGETLLDFLSGKGICIDLSHTSDALAHDILNLIDKKGLEITPIASHSNFRSIASHARNLPDELVKEIINRGGVIGFNFVKAFIGRKLPDDFLKHVEHIRALGGFKHFCFGADFFYDKDVPPTLRPFVPFFFEQFQNASCYPEMLEHLSKSLNDQELKGIAHQNLEAFFLRKYQKESVS